jgi:glutamyl-tRNA synthetase
MRTIEAAVPLVRERLKVLSEAPDMIRYLFVEPAPIDPAELTPKKRTAGEALEILHDALVLIADFESRGDEQNETKFRELAARLGLKLGDVLMPIRVALTGSRVSPPLFDSIHVVGVERTAERMQRAIQVLKAQTGAP